MPGKHKKPSGYKMKYQGNNSAFPFKSPMKQEPDLKFGATTEYHASKGIGKQVVKSKAGKKVTKKLFGKIGKKALIRMIPGIGLGVLAYDAARTIHTVATKGADKTTVGQLLSLTKKNKN
jgi:hypothetical protein